MLWSYLLNKVEILMWNVRLTFYFKLLQFKNCNLLFQRRLRNEWNGRKEMVRYVFYRHLWACKHMKLHLQHFKNALIGSNFLIIFRFAYNSNFKDSSMFLEHIVKEILRSPTLYEFEILWVRNVCVRNVVRKQVMSSKLWV